MKLPNGFVFDRSLASWEAVPQRFEQAFYTGFVMTEGGMVLLKRNFYGDTSRTGVGGDLNVSVLSTSDRDCPVLYTPEGEKVKAAELNQDGQQMLVVDYDHNVAVKTISGWCKRTAWFGYAYWPDHRARPVGSGEFRVSIADRKLGRTMNPYLDNIVNTCTLMLKVQDEPVRSMYHNGKYYRDAHNSMWPHRIAQFEPVDTLIQTTAYSPELLRGLISYISVHRKQLSRQTATFTYLRTKP